MQLGLLVALVAAIIIAENSPEQPVTDAPLRLLLVLVCSVGVGLLAWAGSRTIARRMDREAGRPLQRLGRFALFRQFHLAVWLVAVGLSFYTLGWSQIVRFNWRLDQIVVIKDVVVLVPIWLPLLFSWAAFYEVELAVHRATARQASTVDGSPDAEIASRSQFVWLHVRHYLGLCILPMLLLLACQDLLGLCAPAWEESDGAWLVLLVPVSALMLAFPYILSRVWSTSTLPDSPLRARLTTLTSRMGVRCRDFRVWRTNRQVLNAAVAGLLPSARYVFVTDALLMYLRDEEMEAVIAHELGHVRRRHLWLRVMLVGLPLWVAANFQVFSPHLTELADTWQSAAWSSPGAVGHLLAVGCAFGLAVLVLGHYSRLLEHDADLCVFEAGQAETFIATIDRLSYLCNDQRQRATWLHPSTMSRVHLLERALSDPRAARSFRRRVSLVNRLLLVTWIATPLAATLAAC